ncbi:MAG: hypothetical protein GX409_05380 [candidate division Zixibacteria bacterium]|nr:hypothetical protein [candidate division Zixibacteria bacterium]
MKNLTVLAVIILATAWIFAGCNQQAGLDQIMKNPQMKSYLMEKMMEDKAIQISMIEKNISDSAWVNAFVNQLSRQTNQRDIILFDILQQPGVGEMVLTRLAADPAMKLKMKDLSK